MKDQVKSRDLLINELEEMRRRIAGLEASEIALKRSEEAPRESEARYRAIVEDQNELICRWLPGGRLTFVNGAYCRYFGKKSEELIGHSFMPLIPEEDHERVKGHFASIGPANPVSTHEHRVIAPNGEIRWQQWSNRALFDGEGCLIEFQSVGRDITGRKRMEEELLKVHDKLEQRVAERTAELQKTNEQLLKEIIERRHAEEALREKEEEWRSLVENAPDIIMKVDRDGKILFINRTVPGYSVEETIGKKVYEYIPFEYQDLTREAIEEVFKAGDIVNFETMGAGPEGTHSWYSTRLGPIKRRGEIIAVAQISTDITEYKQAEQELIRKSRELEIKSRSLEDVNATLRVLLKKKAEDERALEEKVLLNMKELVMPYIEELKKRSDKRQMVSICILESNLSDVISPFLHRVSSKYLNLTPAEIQITNLVKQGKTTKDIADYLNLSIKTIEQHRKNIRKKLGIMNEKINLRSHILSFQ